MEMPPLTLDSSVAKVPLVGPSFVMRLNKIGMFTIRDLLYYLPFRYDDFSLVSKIAAVQEGETVTIKGEVLQIKNLFTRGGFVLQNANIRDDTGTITAVWFNQRFLTSAIHQGDIVSLSGKIKRQGKKLQLASPKYEVLSSALQQPLKGQTFLKASVHTGRLVPIYSESLGITSKWLRSRIKFLLDQMPTGRLQVDEFLDPQIKDDNRLFDLSMALNEIHFPTSLENVAKARERLAFDELLLSQLASKQRKSAWEEKKVGNKLEIIGHRPHFKTFVDKLPFTLTAAQRKVIDEIYKDLAKDTPMNRLLQGDVGSGKTVVAALAILASHVNGYQSALMAPTEILALQHHKTLSALLAPNGINIGIATGSTKDHKNKDVIVGTHALLSEGLNFKKLGLVVIDEQHRFGVEQRGKLTGKGVNPHVLTMTATPIPRTIALTLYGDLSMSVIDEMPKDRLPIKTWVVPKEKRAAAYAWIKKQKAQSFIVCPLIEDPARNATHSVAGGSETLTAVRAVKSEYEHLTKDIFPELKLGLLHGQLKPKDKDKVLQQFRDKKLDILVATPVVEVGIDIPNATIMVIEAADRFGLAQLHQLRGRVGRGDQQSYCLLFTDNEESGAIHRLKYLETLNSGLKLAETDLKFRGPGQRFGVAQHGKWDLKIADFSDLTLIEATNKLAEKVSQNPKSFPSLQKMLEKSKIQVVPN